MDTKLEPPDQELYQRVDEVLHYVWDPVGVSGVPMARDEYYSYIPQVLSLLKQGASVQTIASHLDNLVVERIGLGRNPKHSSEVATVLIDWSETIASKYA